MILGAIELRHVGIFTEPVSIGPFARGLNILAAPNESGKTTLVKAATRALFDRHSCKDQEIRALQPIGSSLTPKVAVAFEVASGRFRVEKEFLLSPKCELSEWKAEAWQLIAEGDEADKRLLALLKSAQPGRGASNEAHWGMLRYLWARQGEPTTWPKWDDEAGQLIQSRLAKVELDPLIDRLRARLWEAYLESFTATGQVKTSGSIKKAEDELAKIDFDLAEVRSRLSQLEKLHTEYQRTTGEVALLQERTFRSRPTPRRSASWPGRLSCLPWR